ncbi:Probable carboxyvinyl-carboxyphosphonate phosphorylmutase [hydrothermal vent metagenome]|uniref:Probable carboxyvinyl-carboxyphosphonate phosphorylmutase n=1 Tax=hydrothermal vent metagenome TaxID=652676 RepID=A0A3B0RAY6_9ZZZZ
MENDTLAKYQAFKALHDETFVMPNPWDAGTARILTALGYKALATTSAGYAFSQGKKDSARCLSRDDILANARAIVQATDLPVSADLENGFGDAPETCAETIRAAIEAGLVGGSIEDATGNTATPIYDFGHAVERVTAAVEAARDLPFMVTARAENFLHGHPDLDDTIKRLQAFEAAGADVLYAPGLPDLAAIRTVCAAVHKPVNVMMGLSGPNITVDALRAAGVKRISVGGSFARAALGGFMRAAQEVLETGSFEYAHEALPDAVASGFMASGPAK